ncbi:phenylalanine--tRNA ligase subunit beta [Rickettsiella endosymbiont of Aleochara curtula]|uniref:phenylalanine--tRNA ligase subunit beta n=1 Tax=Rickettsiella endosymbiont of Aleochara curtula TaxID=3077936 RepID=UPI00313AE3FC
MKLSEQWLRTWVNPNLNVKQLAEQLTLAGLEVAGVHPVAGSFDKVVVGEVLSAAPHPDASRLQVCAVNVGAEQSLTIVCGAKNCRAGLKVAVAQVGAHLPQDILIKEAKLRGVVSQGMLCSSSELGFAEATQDSGILELPLDAPIGKDIREYLQLDDHCLDIHLTPNRGDCLSVQGLARDIAAITQQTMMHPSMVSQPAVIQDQIKINVESAEDCPHYAGRIIRNINTQAKTPLWMQERLRRSGVRSIHPVVDVTNYVMLEVGQPLHAFDLKQLTDEVNVRLAHPEESVTLLDGKNIVLDGNTLVIADKNQVQAIAGVMGAAHSAVSDETQDVFLESAYFSPARLAGRARQYGLSSDSAYRFERGVDPAITVSALERATQLLFEIVGGQVGPITHVQAATKPLASIKFRPAHLKKFLGFSLDEEKIATIFASLGIHVQHKATEEWQVTPPTWRFDLSLAVDLIEELARIQGYQHIPVKLPNTPLTFLPQPETQLSLTRLQDLLIARGYRETINYSFTAPKLQQSIVPHLEALSLLNPISSELSVMRTSLWPGLLNSLRYNQQRQQLSCRLFESGVCFHNHSGKLEQQEYLAAVASGECLPEQWGVASTPLDFFSMKSDLEALLSLTAKNDIQFVPGTHPALHPGQSSDLQQAGKIIGYFGALHPKIITELDLIGPIYCFELKTSAISQRHLPQFKAYSKFPMVRRDISFWVDDKYPASTILQAVKHESGECLHQSFLFDVYFAEQEPQKRSLALALCWQHPTRTLVDVEVDELMQKVTAHLKQSFAIQIRE